MKPIQNHGHSGSCLNGEPEFFNSELLGQFYSLTRHKSGLPIYVFPKKTATVHALLATRFGSVDDRLGTGETDKLPLGVAHFLEHKLFANPNGRDAFEDFAALGADANAYTSHSSTVYLFSATDRYEEALGVLLDFVGHPYFTKENVRKEQGIIAEEIRMCRDNPYDRCYYGMLRGLYADHPIKEEICGSEDSILKITPELLYRAYRTFYRPENMALVVVGDVERERIIALADRYLPKRPESGPIRFFTHPEPPAVAQPFVKSYGQVAKPVFSIGIKNPPPESDPQKRLLIDAGMAVLSEMLFSESGELYNELLDSGMISPDFSSGFSQTRDFAFWQISGEADDPEAVLSAILSYLEKVKKNGLCAEDFERARRVEYAEYIKSFDSAEEIAHMLLSFVLDSARIFTYPEMLKKLTLPFLSDLLSSRTDPGAFTLSAVYPNEKRKEALKE